METLNRKKNLVLILIVVLLPFTTFAQSKGLRLGVLFGVGKAKVENEDFLNQSGKIALGGGLGMTYQLTKNIGVYGNLLFTSKGTKSTGTEMFSGPSGQINYSYWKGLSFYAVEIPLMPKLSVRLNRFHLKAFAGPSINFNIHTNEEKIYDDINFDKDQGYKDQKVDVPLLEYSVVWGGGLDAEVSEKDILFVEFRKQEDLNMNAINIVNNNHYYNEYYMISIGYLHKY
jgi:hypothetical protein